MNNASAHASTSSAVYNTSEAEIGLARLKVLAHPQRVAIVDLLRRLNRPLTVTEIYTELGMSQAIASAHLITMRNRKVLEVKKSGTNMYYTLRLAGVTGILECLEEIVQRPK